MSYTDKIIMKYDQIAAYGLRTFDQNIINVIPCKSFMDTRDKGFLMICPKTQDSSRP